LLPNLPTNLKCTRTLTGMDTGLVLLYNEA